jgi:photosystem II stability/assembly factor-like uncharacterized protein
MRGIQVPAAAPRFALALLATSVAVGCGAAQRPAQRVTATAARAASHAAAASHVAASHTPASHAPATGSGASSARLDAIAFASPRTGYGIFTRQAGGRCQALAGRTADAGARFGSLAPVTSWPCAGRPPASFPAADRHGDAFLYDPGLFVTLDGGRTWANGHQPGTVLAIATAGRSVWMLRADCPRHAGACPLRLLESANGGRTWAASPAQPPGATARAVGGGPAQEGAAGQTWLLRTGRSSGYVLSYPADDAAPMWFTADAGATWSRRQVRCGPVGAMSATLAAAPDGSLLAVCAGQPGAGNQAKSAGRSTDGGRSWAVHTPCPPARLICRRGMPLYSGYLAQITAVSAGTGFLAGGRSSLLVTTDAGRHWQTVRPLIGDGSGGTSQVIFVNSRDGFVLGEGARTNEMPTIWRTTDGGTRWAGVAPRP